MQKNLNFEETWKKEIQSTFYSRLKNGESLQTILGENPFFLNPTQKIFLSCCDGRIKHNSKEYNIAGSGILLSESDLDSLMKNLQGKITTITSHEDCGAAALAFKLRNISEFKDPVEYAQSWTREIAQKYGFDYRHINSKEFNCSKHHEVGLCIDTNGRINLEVNDFPNMFISHSAFLQKNEEYISEETQILTDIAFSNHGFGERFTKENQFQILIISKTEEEIVKISNLIDGIRKKYGKRVNIQGALLS